MCDGYFVCQLKYTRRGWPELIDGKVEEVYDSEEKEKNAMILVDYYNWLNKMGRKHSMQVHEIGKVVKREELRKERLLRKVYKEAAEK